MTTRLHLVSSLADLTDLPAGWDPRGDDPRAIVVAGEAISRRELLAQARAVAAEVAGHQRVAVFAEPSLATVVAVVGCLMAGVTAVPVAPDSAGAELRHVLHDSGVTAWAGRGPSGAVDLPLGPVVTALDEDDVALILYTSGTTGSPKGVPITTSAISQCLDGLADAWQWSAQDTLAHGLPLFHVHGLVLGVLGALRVGSRLVHVGRPTPAAHAASDATLVFGVPTIWARIAADEDACEALRSARLLVSGSAALPRPVFERLRERTGHEVVERYGMTECLIILAARADEPRAAGTVGRPIRGVTTRLRDEKGHDVAHDGKSIGRLEVRGATVFSGYLGRPDATTESFTRDGWFNTGDIATIGAGGVHRIVGREASDLIKSGGYRIGAGEIEDCLLGHPAVRECAVVGIPDDDLGMRIVAFVVPDQELNAEDVMRHAASNLSAHKRPREIRVVAELPRNPMGKVRKADLLG